MKRKVLASVLAGVLAVGVLTGCGSSKTEENAAASEATEETTDDAAAEETDFYKGLKYLKYSDYAEVIDCDQTRTTIKIPSSIGGLPVRVIAERAFYGCKSLETVTGGGNVQVIAPNAFSSCTALTSIGAMDSLQSIGSSAFSDCVSLSNIPSSQSLKSIGDLAFFNCVSLQSVAIPATLTTLGENVFGDCTSLQTFAVENGNIKPAPCHAFFDFAAARKPRRMGNRPPRPREIRKCRGMRKKRSTAGLANVNVVKYYI